MYNVKRKLCKVTPEIIKDCKFYNKYKNNEIPNYKTQINHFVMIGTMDRVCYLKKLVTRHFTKALDIIRDLTISDNEAAKRVKKVMQSIRKITSQSKPKLHKEFMQYMALQINYYDSKESFEKYSILYDELLDNEFGKINTYENLKELRDKVAEAKNEFQKIFDLSHEKYNYLLYPYFNNIIYNIEHFVICLRIWIKCNIFYIFDTNYGETYIPII